MTRLVKHCPLRERDGPLYRWHHAENWPDWQGPENCQLPPLWCQPYMHRPVAGWIAHVLDNHDQAPLSGEPDLGPHSTLWYYLGSAISKHGVTSDGVFPNNAPDQGNLDLASIAIGIKVAHAPTSLVPLR